MSSVIHQKFRFCSFSLLVGSLTLGTQNRPVLVRGARWRSTTACMQLHFHLSILFPAKTGFCIVALQSRPRRTRVRPPMTFSSERTRVAFFYSSPTGIGKQAGCCECFRHLLPIELHHSEFRFSLGIPLVIQQSVISELFYMFDWP